MIDTLPAHDSRPLLGAVLSLVWVIAFGTGAQAAASQASTVAIDVPRCGAADQAQGPSASPAPDPAPSEGNRLALDEGSVTSPSSGDVAATDGPMLALPAPGIARIGDLDLVYRLRVDLTYRSARLQVHEGIRICNRTDRVLRGLHLSMLAHALGEMQLGDVRVAGHRVAARFENPASALIRFPAELGPGQGTTIVLRFTDHASRSVDTSLDASLSRADGLLRVSDWFALVSDGHGLRRPGDAQSSDAAKRITLDLHYDRPLVVAAPGALIRHGRHRRVYRIRGARDYAFLVAPHLEHATARTPDGVHVVAYADSRRDAANLRDIAVDALQAYADVYGPYPWGRFVLAPTPRRLSAHEDPALVFIGLGWMEGPAPWEWRWLRHHYLDRWVTVRSVVAHEVAHQWFYALVGNDQLTEPWLDEAMAEFSADHFFRPRVFVTCSHRPVTSTVYDFPDGVPGAGCDSYWETIYRRGAVMIEGVRRLMGDAAFFDAVREYVQAHRFGVATASDLVAAWRRHAPSPADLDRYLQPFLGARG
jgi:hypothetical protein